MAASGEAQIERRPDGVVVVHLSGAWRLDPGLPGVTALGQALDEPTPARALVLDADRLGTWDSSLVLFVERARASARRRGLPIDAAGLPDGLRRLIGLAETPVGEPPPPPPPRPTFVTRVGQVALAAVAAVGGLFTLIGDLTFSLVRLATGRAQYRDLDLLTELQATSARALSIVGTVAFLLGMILAFVGGVTLRPFAATLYVPNVVTVAMVRELGPVMTAIVMAGRTGSAYAAQLGTMKVTQETDALATMGLRAIDFLVLPRVLALSLMMPFLCVYADAVALIGGALVAVARGDNNLVEFVRQSRGAIPLSTFFVGLSKSLVFGVVVALTGCLQGLRVGKSAAAVGEAATEAVVTSIVAIVALDGLFAMALSVLGL